MLGRDGRGAGFSESRDDRERLVAVVLVPGTEAEPKTFASTGFTRKSLGTRTVEEFAAIVQGMKRSVLTEKGRPRAVLFALRTPDGDSANIVCSLLGGSQAVVDDPPNLKGGMGTGDGGSMGQGGGTGGQQPELFPGFCALGAQKPNWWRKEFLARGFRTVSSRGRARKGDACDSDRVPSRVPLGGTSCWDGRWLLPADPTGVP